MTDDIDQIRRDLEAVVAAASDALDRLRAISARPILPVTERLSDRPDLGIKDLIPAADGAEIAHRAKKTITAWCKKNPIDGDAGFALKIGARWLVSRSRLVRHLAVETKSSGSSD